MNTPRLRVQKNASTTRRKPVCGTKTRATNSVTLLAENGDAGRSADGVEPTVSVVASDQRGKLAVADGRPLWWWLPVVLISSAACYLMLLKGRFEFAAVVALAPTIYVTIRVGVDVRFRGRVRGAGARKS